jgi:hypothetical protein
MMATKMSKLKVFIQKNKTAASFWIGAILILTGIGLSIYVDSVIKSQEEKLFFSDLTQQERWDLEGSYQWWRMARITIYDPTSIMLIAVGLVVLTHSFLSAVRHTSRMKPRLFVSP